MNRNPDYFKLGLFVISALGLAAAFLIAFGAGEFLKKEFIVETYFDESVQGLDVGSEVKYKGIRIGTVKSISNPAEIYNVASNHVRVTFNIDDNTFVGQTGADSRERMIKAVEQGLEIQLSYKGITGGAYLEADYYPPKKSPLKIDWSPRHLYIPSRKSDFQEIGDAVSRVLDDFSKVDLDQTLTHVTELLADLHKKSRDLDLAAMGNNANALLKELRDTNARLSRALDSQEIKGLVTDTRETIQSVKHMVTQATPPLNQALTDLGAAARSTRNLTADLEQNLPGNVAAIAQQADAALVQMEATIRMIESLIQTNEGPIGQTLENFRRTSDNLKQLSRELKLYPGRILEGPPPSPLNETEAP